MATPSRNHYYDHPHIHPTAPFARPAYPAYAAPASQFPSASSSACQSSSSLASLSTSSQAGVMSSQPQPQQRAPSSSFSTSTSYGQYQYQHQHQHHNFAAAPLPSPDATHKPNQYFGSLHPQGQTTTQQQQQGQPVSLQRHGSLERRPDRAGGVGAGASAESETMACLRDYNLVAEAAKRAQMAVLMRDLEGVEL